MASRPKSLVPASSNGGGRGGVKPVGGRGGRKQAMPKGGKRVSAKRMGRPMGY